MSLEAPLERRGQAFGLHFLRCPSAESASPEAFADPMPHTVFWEAKYGAHYGYNLRDSPWEIVRSQRIFETPDYFLIADSKGPDFPSPDVYAPSLWRGWVAGDGVTNTFPDETWRHEGRFNFAYRDGHVLTLPKTWFVKYPNRVPAQIPHTY